MVIRKRSFGFFFVAKKQISTYFQEIIFRNKKFMVQCIRKGLASVKPNDENKRALYLLFR